MAKKEKEQIARALETTDGKAYQGLSDEEAKKRQAIHGRNVLESAQHYRLLESLMNIAREPMFILLVAATILYFFIGDSTSAIMMMVSIAFVSGIAIYQETKSERALDALRKYAQQKVNVLRSKKWKLIDSDDLVPGDIVAIEEGEAVPADGDLISGNDLMIDEAMLTGESLPVEKAIVNATAETDQNPARLFMGTTVTGGRGVFRVTAIGVRTELGKLGKSIEEIDPSPTPLQEQINRFVRQMGYLGLLAFAITFLFNYWVEANVWKALLFSLTLAMAILPQEIPVAFSTFMGIGAYRMIKRKILAKQPKTVESLGSATVICLDKTGTITQNKMSVAEVTDFSGNGETLMTALFASEPEPFDAMELAIMKDAKAKQGLKNDPRSGYRIVKEYPLSGKPPMMTHVWEDSKGHRVVAAKGGIEHVLDVCVLQPEEKEQIKVEADQLAAKGFRVLGVASAVHRGDTFPTDQDAFQWKFEGMVSLFDPPKKDVDKVLQRFYKAGIRVIMLTGDHVETARNIAKTTGIQHSEVVVTGKDVMQYTDSELQSAVHQVNVFARMFPEAKLRVIEALKAQGEIVAMSGDGVNDAPALKSAQIGIAMGKKGADLTKNTASLVLMNDDLGSMVTAVKMGRRIYTNLRKAIRYIISIHLPILLTVLVPLVLGWPYKHIFLPLHVIFLELVMDPTAAIAFENEPAEKNIMKKGPRRERSNLFSGSELGFSLLQGVVITLGIMAMYQYGIRLGKSEPEVRSFVFATMVFANLFLTLTNRSFEYTIATTIFYKNKTLPIILAVSIFMLTAIIYFPFLAKIFQVAPISAVEYGICAFVGMISVFWFELYKVFK